jgi:alpha-glucosidase
MAAEQGINKAVFREAVVMQMTWVGAPTIYYGDEAGLCGFTDPDNRRTYPWGREDTQMIQFHRDIIRLRKENPELRYGSLKYVDSFYNFTAYGRFSRSAQCLILVNNNDCPVERQLFVWDLGTAKDGRMKTIFQTDENGYRMEGPEYEVFGGKIRVNMPKTSAIVLKYFPE